MDRKLAYPAQSTSRHVVTITDAEDVVEEHPVVRQITEYLHTLDIANWQRFGERFEPTTIYPKALEFFEEIYTTNIQGKVLALRRSIPVMCQFVRPGYRMMPCFPDAYTMELRPMGWNALALVDPYHRGRGNAEENREVLAEGEFVRNLLEDVRTRYERTALIRQREFQQSARELIDDLVSEQRKPSECNWQRTFQDRTRTVYVSEINGMKLELSHDRSNDGNLYSAICTQKEFEARIIATRSVQTLFQKIDELCRIDKLCELSKLLKLG